MEEKKKTWGRRPETRFWVWAEQWLLGSTRTELNNEERAVFMDFLCLASMKGGYIECFARDQLASQLCISRELLDECIKKFIETGKIEKKYQKREKKEIFYIKKWEQYQPEYLWKKPYKSTRKARSIKPQKSDAHVDPIREEMRKEKNRKDEISSEESQDDKLQNSHLKSFSLKEDFSEGKKKEFLVLLKSCSDYPFNENTDSIVFEIVSKKHPNIDIVHQLKKKIEWWTQKASPTAVKSKPRTQLLDHFEKAFTKKEKEPEKVGKIAEKVIANLDEETRDKIAWLETEIRRSEAKNNKENKDENL